jgi:CheY-like chemotaxis protein
VTPEPAADPSSLEHDLINSLASILGFSQVIRRDPALPEELRRSAELLIQEATRTRSLVQDLLDLARQRSSEPGATAFAAAAADAPAARATGAAGAVDARVEAIATPADAPAAQAEPAQPPTTQPRPRVLVLDDEPTFRLFLEKALTLLGYEPVITSLGPEAVERAADGDLAALLFDHQMPGVSGVDAYEALIATRPDLAPRLVLMSGDVLDPAVEAFATRHAVRLLAKPFDLDTLDGTIRAVMAATGQVRG